MKFLIYLLAIVASASSQSNSDILKAINANFTADFFQEVIKEKPNRSIVISAFSSLSLLVQLAKSSREATRDRILKAIGFTNYTEVIQEQLDLSKQELRFAEILYTSNYTITRDEFLVNSKELYKSGSLNTVEFSENVQTAEKINTWVENNTNNKVKNIVSPRSLGASTAAVVVNSVYFKGNWSKAFNPRYTVNGSFRVSSYETIILRFMNQRNTFKYGESSELNAKLLDLPYQGNLKSLLIVLPYEYDGIDILKEKLRDPLILSRAKENMRFREVRAVIPRFKIETFTDLERTLNKVIDAANPSQITGQEDKLRINKALQKATIEVSEEGSEVAAANEFTMVTGARFRRQVFPNLVYFTASHPFYFALQMDNMDAFNGIFIK